MIFGEILELVGRIFEALLNMLGLSSGTERLDPQNSLRVFVKYLGRSVQVDLDPSWNVGKVKEHIAPKLGNVNPKEIKIIFAGNELPDDFVLQTCDVGQQSYLHAVRVHVNNSELNSPSCPSSPIPSTSRACGQLTPGPDAEENGPTSATSTPTQLLATRTRTFSLNDSKDDETENIVTGEASMSMSEESLSSPPPESDFFVFCSQCCDCKEGKLRVRCATCLSGAFTVALEQRPEGWEDVLVPSRIQGTCQEGCLGTFAQFYFKCTSHVTKGEDDSSPPLPLVKRNFKNGEYVPCLACGDVKEPVLIFQCQSKHVTCIDCFKEYVLVKLNQREFVQDSSIGYTLGCPALCKDSLVEDPHHFKLLGRYQYDRYQRFGTEECLLQMGGLFCPQPDCGMGIIPVDSGCDKIACMHGCGYVFCRKCLEGWHLGPCRSENPYYPVASTSTSNSNSEDCYRATGYYVSEDRAALAQWGDPTRRALRLSTKPCPNCRVPTERAGGCMHMECTKCKLQWCWVCQIKWTRECMGNHWFG